MAATKNAETTKLNIRVPAALARRLKVRCARTDTRIQDAVAAALSAWLKRAEQ